MKVTGPKGVAARNGSKTVTVSLTEYEQRDLRLVLDYFLGGASYDDATMNFASDLLDQLVTEARK